MNDDVSPTETQNIRHLSRLPIPETMGSDPNRKGCLGSKSMTLEERLEMWIVAQCQEQNPRPRRATELNAILREIYRDRRFWKYKNTGNPDDYEDAMFLMWQNFLNNLCEVNPARKRGSLILPTFWWKWHGKIQNDRPIKPEMIELWFISLVDYIIKQPRSFFQTRHNAVNRLLASLKGNLKNLWKQRQQKISREVQPYIGESGEFIDPAELVPYYDPEPDLEPDPVVVFNKFLKLLAEDLMGELNAEVNTLRGIKESTKKSTTQESYALTAQVYLLMRYRDRKTDQQIANELDITRQSLQPNGGKPKKWVVLARNLAQMAKDSVIEQGG